MRLDEITIQRIATDTKRAFPNTGRENLPSSIAITRIIYDVYQPTNQIRCEASVMSSGTAYTSIIEFLNVDFVDENDTTTQQGVELIGTNTRTYRIVPMSVTVGDALVSCTCEDFRFRFAFYNFQKRCLYGNLPPQYVRRTQTRPPANPTKSIGMCKHLHAVVNTLRREGKVR